MYRKDAASNAAECADGAQTTGCIVEPEFSESTWIIQDAKSETAGSGPLVGEMLAEFDRKFDSLASQLDALADLRSGAQANFGPQRDYLLDQFRVLTFTIGGAMNRELFTDARKTPVSLLKSIHSRFSTAAEQLSAEFTRMAQPETCIHEIQRQSRSISQRMVIAIERLCDRKANDFLDDLEAIAAEFELLTNQGSAANRESIGPLGQQCIDALTQFADAVQQTNQYASFTHRFQRVIERANRSLNRLMAQSVGQQQIEIKHLHVRLGFVATQFVIRCNDAAMPKRVASRV